MSDWTRFFVLRLPLAALAIALAAEAGAWLLSGVTLHRHTVDDLANAVLHDRHPYRVVLLGDSVTHNVAHKFRIGEADEVADLTTHGQAGLPSSLFLLARYLESGHRPEHVVLADSFGRFVEPMLRANFDYYVGSVFREPQEREFLQRYYADYVDYRWKPAALSMTTRLGEPLFSLLRHPGDQIWAAPQPPAAEPALERFPGDAVDPAVLQQWLDAPAQLRPEARAILAQLCQLSRRYGFTLHVVWPPMQTQLRRELEAQGKLRRIEAELRQIFAENDVPVSIEDASQGRDYPYFDRALLHIKGLGWEQAYANALTGLIHRYEQAPPRGS